MLSAEGVEWIGRRSESTPTTAILSTPGGWWLQVFEGETSSSEHVFRIGVEDIERERDRLLRLGVPVQEIVRAEGVIAFCDFVDPYGNSLSLYQVLA